MSEYVPIEYPKMVNGVIVENAAEEHAILDEMTRPGAENPATEAPAEHPEPV